jgi:hypothetical protein
MSEEKDIRFVFESAEAKTDAGSIKFNSQPLPKHFESRFKSSPKEFIERGFGSIEQKDWNDWR